MEVEVVGDIIFANEFWDCECEKNFTHRKSNTRKCPICGFEEHECADSRLDELLKYESRMLTADEIKIGTFQLAVLQPFRSRLPS